MEFIISIKLENLAFNHLKESGSLIVPRQKIDLFKNYEQLLNRKIKIINKLNDETLFIKPKSILFVDSKKYNKELDQKYTNSFYTSPSTGRVDVYNVTKKLAYKNFLCLVSLTP